MKHPMLIDTHCHLDVSDFDADRDSIISTCTMLGIEHIVVPGIAAASWDALLAICQRYPSLHPALGLHPIYLDAHRMADIATLEHLIDTHKIIAIGEIGLDYLIEHLDRSLQQTFFEAQLNVAVNTGLPVLLHVRKAHDAVIKTLRRIKPPGGIVHAFNGSFDQGLHYIDLGFKLGFGGMLTYERSTRLRDLAHRLPLESIVLETDAPDMTVARHRGERNSPAYLVDCLAALAEIRELNLMTVAVQTTRNSLEVLRL